MKETKSKTGPSTKKERKQHLTAKEREIAPARNKETKSDLDTTQV